MEKDLQEYKEVLKKAVKKINDLSSELKEVRDEQSIAIIGYNCRFPGGANNPDDFWRLLTQGYDAVTEIGADRFDINKYYNADKGIPGKIYTRNAAFLDTDIKSFDNVHFDILAVEAVSLDPQHKLLLEVSWEAMENAGLSIPQLKGSKTGVFVGISSYEYIRAEMATNEVEKITPYSLFGTALTSAAGRLSYFYDFKGPAVACDTACSSSLVALNMAMDSLRNGQCDMAIVGGVNLILCPQTFIGLSQLQALAADGRCKVFDDSADGFGRGEGCGVVLLKRMDDAIKDGNTIEAVIKSSIIGQDGRANGYYAPNGLSESDVMRQTIKTSGLSVDDVDYIEAHGTGTTLGDFIEIQAILEAYKNKQEPMLVGSVKSNIGHLEAAAGMASLIKVLLSLKHRKLPPSINCKKPNRNINRDKIKVVTTLTDWQKNSGKRRAGISCFGISGTLAHVIVEEPDKVDDEGDMQDMPCNILTLSAKSIPALRQAMTNMRDYIANGDAKLSAVTYSSNITRSHLPCRFAAVGTKKENIINAITTALEKDENFAFNTNVANDKRKKIAFLFTGQGSIYKNIAKELYEYSKEFRDAFMDCESAFAELLGISIKEAVFDSDEAVLNRPLYSQPVIFSIEYALSKVWETLGITPDVVIGHSIGEYAAACYSGLISFGDAVKMIVARGKLMEAIDIEGKMVGVLADAETVKKAIADSNCKSVSIAAVNAPKNVTISGRKDEVDEVLDVLQRNERVFINDLKINRPYHSEIMQSYEQSYSDYFSNVSFAKPRVKIISCVTGKFEQEDVLGKKEYWAGLLSQTVDFRAAMEEAWKADIKVFIEIGGTATLCGLANQCIRQDDAVFVPSLRSGRDAYRQLLDSVKTLYLSGVEINWDRFYSTYTKEKVLLPNYPFRRKLLWKELIYK